MFSQANSTKHTNNNIKILPKLFQKTEEEGTLPKALHDGTNPDTTTGESASRSAMSSSFDPTDYTVHGILQARILVWVAFLFSRGSSQPRDQTQVSCIAGRFFTSWATREAQEYCSGQPIPSPADLPDPGIKPGSPPLPADFLPTELSGKPHHN